MVLMPGSRIAGLLARQMNPGGVVPGPLVTTLAQGAVNILGAANTVLTSDAATAGGVWGLLVNANVAAAAAIAGTKIAPDFGAQDITTTGDLILNNAASFFRMGLVAGSGAGSASSTGIMRVFHGWTLLGRNSADGADRNLFTWGTPTANEIRIGGTGATISVRNVITCANNVLLESAVLQFTRGVVAPALNQANETSAVNSDNLTIRAQANSNVGAFQAGNLLLRGGNNSGGGTNGNLGLHGAAANWQSMEDGVFVGDATANPTGNPANGGFFYSTGGAGTWRGSGGTITTFGPAEPHCQRCGRDFAVEYRNDEKYGHLAVCVWCMSNALKRAGISDDEYIIQKKAA